MLKKPSNERLIINTSHGQAADTVTTSTLPDPLVNNTNS